MRIVNLSLGAYTLDDQPPTALRQALRRLLRDQDRVVVAAAGNDGQAERPFWPAAFAGQEEFAEQVVAVAAHGSDLALWSNRGPWVTLAAPGADVESTYIHHEEFPSGWAQWSGTSFATPYVVAELVSRLSGGESAAAALSEIRRTAEASQSGYIPFLP